MRETTRDNQFPNDSKRTGEADSKENLPAKDVPAEKAVPTESEMVIISLLMRIYDLNLAMLSHMDEARASEVYEAHEKGGTFNPAIFVPDIESLPED